jgi:hypothetical protein
MATPIRRMLPFDLSFSALSCPALKRPWATLSVIFLLSLDQSCRTLNLQLLIGLFRPQVTFRIINVGLICFLSVLSFSSDYAIVRFNYCTV